MAPHLGLQRIMIPSAQVSSLTTGSVTLPSARGQFVESSLFFIETITASGSSSTLEFTNIPQTYTNLMILATGRAAGSAGGTGVSMRFNSDSGSNYNETLYQFERTNSSYSTGLPHNNSTNKMYIDVKPDGAYTSNVWNACIIDIPNYASTSVYKHALSQTTSPFTTGATSYQWHIAGGWMSTAAISSIQLVVNVGQNFASGSIYSLYGVL